MKKTRIALAISSSLLATSAFATNGTNMIGVGAQSAAMGGTGTAAFYGAENVIVNPGLIGKSEGTEFSFGGTLFKPSVESELNVHNAAAAAMGAPANMRPPVGKATSEADTNVIPSVSLTSRINDNLTFGIGMYGTSGMGVDYKKDAYLFKAQSQMQIMRFAPSLAYNGNRFGIGVSTILQYGSLDINYETQMRNKTGAPQYYQGDGSIGSTQSNEPVPLNVGSGVASDLGMGYTLGGYFDVTKDLTLALSYQSAINMKYENQLSTASKTFVNPMSDFKTPFSDELEQPAEIKVGVAYDIANFTLTADYKNVAWSSAKGYKDFGWEDQNVIALGAKYSGQKFWVGAGYNTANNPIKAQNGATSYKGAVTNMFNNLFFPATTESHMSFGGGYNLTKHVALEGAIVYAPEVTTTVDTTAVSSAFANNNPAPSQSTTKHSQMGYTFAVRYNF